MGFSRQEYWSGLPFLSPGDLTNPGTKPQSLASPALADGSRLWILKPQPLEVRPQWQPPALRSNGPRGFRWPAGGSPELSSFPRMGFVAVGPSVWGTAAALLTQSRPTLCDPLDCSPPGSSVHGILPLQEYWSGLPFLSPGDLHNTGIEPGSPALQVDSLPLSHLGSLIPFEIV